MSNILGVYENIWTLILTVGFLQSYQIYNVRCVKNTAAKRNSHLSFYRKNQFFLLKWEKILNTVFEFVYVVPPFLFNAGCCFSEALILTSVNQKYDLVIWQKFYIFFVVEHFFVQKIKTFALIRMPIAKQ